ncbi:ROK family protein [Sulfurimonas sp.]|uniref:ROK family protein n=1 Tax=Sulfurimonas sp. TaxID=2022749 RepID=UPI003568EA97
MNLAIDAGGTNLRAQIWNKDKVVKSLSAKSSETGLYTWIVSILNEFTDIKTVGIAYAGQVEDGKIISAPNIEIDKHEIKQAIESEFDLSLKIENDLTCAVLAESNAHKSENICALYVGTGLGLGVIESGKILRGKHNIAAEIGHIPYKKSPLECGCGRDNCIELYASGSGLKKWIKHLDLNCDVTLENLKKSNKELLNEFEEALKHAVGVAVTLFNPEILVLGGSVITQNHYLKDIIINQIENYALPQALKDLKICISDLEDAPLQGALLLKDYNG